MCIQTVAQQLHPKNFLVYEIFSFEVDAYMYVPKKMFF